MCGIAGIIDPTLTKDNTGLLLNKMLESIAHRGPDNRGVWIDMPVALGHNRLTIIDLSDAGNQPMEYFDAVITFNGEIYNYIEVRENLKKKGYPFSTQSDTEVILAAYREYGKECVKYFVGMWAFAIWDKRKKQLFCSRDRFGIKPFYYIHEGDRFYFGSEYKPLKLSPLFSNDLNLDQVSRGLQLGWIAYHDETYYKKLKALPEAGNLIYADGKVTVEKYWDIETGKRYEGTFEEKKNKYYELFKESVNIHLRSDVEIAICLSGGIDSSSLTAMMSHLNPQTTFKSFSIYYDGPDGVDERPFINAVIEKYSQVKPDYIQPGRDAIIENFHDMLYKLDLPASGSSNFSHYFLVKRINENKIKVVVDGQGADEYLAGYMHSFYRLFADDLRKANIFSAISGVNELRLNQQWSYLKAIDAMGKSVLSCLNDENSLYSLEYKRYFPYISKLDKSHIPFNLKKVKGNKLDNFLYHMMDATSLPTILHYVDRMTMSHSLESRVPFLDHRLVEFGFQLNNEDKLNHTRTKYILRESMKGLLPEKIYNRKDKKGFVTPGEINWLRGSLKHLLDLDYNHIDFLDKKKVKNVVADYKSGDNKNAKLVWRIATLNYWMNNLM